MYILLLELPKLGERSVLKVIFGVAPTIVMVWQSPVQPKNVKAYWPNAYSRRINDYLDAFV